MVSAHVMHPQTDHSVTPLSRGFLTEMKISSLYDSLGLALEYVKRNQWVHKFCHCLLALPTLPIDKICPIFNRLTLTATTPQLTHLNGTCAEPDWTATCGHRCHAVFWQSVCTNNDVEANWRHWWWPRQKLVYCITSIHQLSRSVLILAMFHEYDAAWKLLWACNPCSTSMMPAHTQLESYCEHVRTFTQQCRQT